MSLRPPKRNTADGAPQSSPNVGLHSKTGTSRKRALTQPEPLVLAAMALERILSSSAPAATVLPAVFRRFHHVDERHRSRASELVYTTTRMRRSIEAQLSAHALEELPSDVSVRSYLLVAATELLYMGRLHEMSFFAIDVAVSQIAALRGPRMAGKVDGMLTRLLASQSGLARDDAGRERSPSLSATGDACWDCAANRPTDTSVPPESVR